MATKSNLKLTNSGPMGPTASDLEITPATTARGAPGLCLVMRGPSVILNKDQVERLIEELEEWHDTAGLRQEPEGTVTGSLM